MKTDTRCLVWDSGWACTYIYVSYCRYDLAASVLLVNNQYVLVKVQARGCTGYNLHYA